MAVVNYSGTVSTTETFVSTDTVTFTGATTVTGSITKTDALAMTVSVGAGVVITISTGYIDIKGSRGAFVTFDSSVALASRKAGDWNYFEFTGSSTSNTVVWAIFKNGKHNLIFQGHVPAEGKFQYLFTINCTVCPAGLFTTSTTGTTVLSDIGASRLVESNGIYKNQAGLTCTWKQITLLRSQSDLEDLFNTVSTGITVQDIYIQDLGLNFAVASPGTLTLTRAYVDHPYSSQTTYNAINKGTGDVVVADSIFTGTRIPCRIQGGGTVTVTNCDIMRAVAANEGLYGDAGVGTLTATSCYIAGTNGADPDNVDTSTAVPNSNSTPPQYLGVDTMTTPRSTPNFPTTWSAESGGTPDGSSTTVTGTSGIICKGRVIYGTATGVYTMSSEWDAPDVLVGGITVPCVVTDWGAAGVKYGTSKSIALSNLKSDTTYYAKLEGVDPFGRVFRSAEVSFATTAAAGDTTAPPVPSDVTVSSPADQTLRVAFTGTTDTGGGTTAYYEIHVHTAAPTDVNVTDATYRHPLVIKHKGAVSHSQDIDTTSDGTTKLTRGTTYHARVVAVDGSFNRSAGSTSTSVAVGDNTAPSVVA